MAYTALYDDRISGGLIATALASEGASGSSLVVIPYANGQRVVILRDS